MITDVKQQEGDMNRIDLIHAEWQLMEKLWDHARRRPGVS